MKEMHVMNKIQKHCERKAEAKSREYGCSEMKSWGRRS